MYRLSTYYTFNRHAIFVELPDNAYGEWIIYDNLIPRYHVNVFDDNNGSNIKIKSLIEDKNETIESIISKININQNTKLSLGVKPTIQIIKSSELVELELIPLPELWIKTL